MEAREEVAVCRSARSAADEYVTLRAHPSRAQPTAGLPPAMRRTTLSATARLRALVNTPQRQATWYYHERTVRPV